MRRPLTISCVMLLTAMTAFAVSPAHMRQKKTDAPGAIRDHFRITTAEVTQKQPTATRATEATVKVTCTFPDEFFPDFYIYNDDVFLKTNDEGWNMDSYDTYVFDVVPGTYDIATNFRGKIPAFEGFDGYAYIVHENVEITQDMTVTFSPKEITERITMNPVMRDGSEATLEVINKDDRASTRGSQDFNTHSISYDYVFYRQGCNPIGSAWIYYDSVRKEGEKRPLEIATNKLSEKYHLTVLSYITTEANRDFECSLTDHRGMETASFNNYIENSVKYPYPEFARTPLYMAEGVEEDNSLIQCSYWIDNVQMAGLGSYTPEMYPTMYVACQPGEGVDLKAVVTPCSMQMQKTVTMEEEEDGEIYTWDVEFEGELYGIPAWYDGKQWKYINQNHSECGNFSYQVPAEGPVVEYPGLAPYCYSAPQLTAPLGNSTPICAIMTQRHDYGFDYIYFSSKAWIGRWGEVRNCDEFATRSIVKDASGKVLFDSDTDGNLEYWLDEYFPTPHTPQRLSVEYYNPNILIDGEINGFNRTTFSFDENNADVFSPTPQMLIFKNTAGEITDRFEYASDGVIEFSAGDFNYEVEGRHSWFDVEKADVKVEYAAYGGDEWQPIEVTEVPEYFYMPGFGYFYRGSLKDVNLPSANGWYDLRLTFSDDADNTTIEHISPAFRIGTGSGIEQVSGANDADAVWYDLQGRRVAAPIKGVYIRVSEKECKKVVL